MTQFDFYLLNVSFRKPEQLELDELKSSIEQLSKDCEFIRENDEKIYRHHSIYEEVFWDRYNISDILHIPEVSETLGRDYHYMMQTIIDHSHDTTLENDEIIELLNLHTQDLVSGLLCLHDVEEIDQRYCVYDQNDWYSFHRYFLSIYPISEEWFASRCPIYFPAIHFHNNIQSTLRTLERGITHFSNVIVDCLSCLNDHFRNCLIPNNIPQSLRNFSLMLDLEVSNEGNAQRRNALSFTFLNDDNREESIYCEPHIKVSSSRRPGDNTYYYNRIYFHPGHSRIAGGKVLVGHIGSHL